MDGSIRKGRHAFGAWEFTNDYCTYCGVGTICVRYHTSAKFQFTLLSVKGKRSARRTEPIDLSKTILKKHRNPIGVPCGCYAKFHRQVAHISDKRTARQRS
jgi:hypothetical protein